MANGDESRCGVVVGLLSSACVFIALTAASTAACAAAATSPAVRVGEMASSSTTLINLCVGVSSRTGISTSSDCNAHLETSSFCNFSMNFLTMEADSEALSPAELFNEAYVPSTLSIKAAHRGLIAFLRPSIIKSTLLAGKSVLLISASVDCNLAQVSRRFCKELHNTPGLSPSAVVSSARIWSRAALVAASQASTAPSTALA
mmetsp:Transcript_98612/g.155846  ORF Transcript_98612/g.155846 Transcript_98612/m.155846 type:complete len:203 (-) Transcript_98612:370-978(-)